ncbi:monocarboxylate transporter 12-like isoform X1 [Tubulanus polymorphus]|uniref:monocarboxylate transporter 12-like isoform X1 n=1 Tax=Tubulanus polymorphus TaxID=672921 RepID=UPI003DA1D39B
MWMDDNMNPDIRENGVIANATNRSQNNVRTRENQTAKNSDLEKGDEKSEPVRHYVPAPPDGGYGWIICVCSFFCQMICDGLIFSFGVVFVTLLEHFHESRSLTSWVGGVFLGVSMFNAPVAGALSKVFGFRVVAIAGAIIATAGMLASSYVPNIPIMIFTMGIIGGFGMSLPYLISMVMVGSYFERRRSLANGIALCGSGVGAFVFSPLLEYLLSTYSWQGTFIILAGITLQGCIFGALFRQPPVREVMNCDLRSCSSLISDAPSADLNKNRKTERRYSISVTDLPTKTDNIRPSSTIHATTEQGRPLLYTQLHADHADTDHHRHTETSPLPSRRLKTSSMHDLNAINRIKHRLIESTMSGSDASLFHRPSGELYKSVQYLGFQEPHTLSRSQIAMNASILNLTVKSPPGGEAWVDHMTSTSYHSNTDLALETVDADITWCELVKRKFFLVVWSLGLPLLNDPVCVMIVASNIFWTGQAAVFTYLVDFARFKGIDNYEAAFLLSVIGMVNLIGRIAFGWLTDFPQVDSVIMYSIGLVLAAVANFAIPFCSSYAALLSCSVLYGMAMSAYVSLRSIIVVDLLGIGYLTQGLGLVIMFQGISYTIVPSIAGTILDISGSYTVLFITSGCFYLLAAVVVLPVKLKKWKAAR